MKFTLKTLLLLFSLIYTNMVYSQGFCMTKDISKNLEYFNQNKNFSKKTLSDSYKIRIYFHIIRDSNGNGGLSINEINSAKSFLDKDYISHGISFFWDNEIDFIDDNRLYRNANKSIFDINNHSDGIDIYLFDRKNNINAGLANGIGEETSFFISGQNLAISSVMSHEMGHVLFLFHTHHGTIQEGGGIQCRELVNGTNAKTCGDYIVDTPADPYLGFRVDEQCNWRKQGRLFDKNNDAYTPNTRQIMAYTNIDCMSEISSDQAIRIKTAIETIPNLNKTIIQEACSENITITQTVDSGQTDKQQATASITATNTISSGGIANYTAGKSVILQTGFQALNGSDFTAKIQDCSSSSRNFSRNTTRVEPRISSKNTLDQLTTYPNPTTGLVTLGYAFKENTDYSFKLHSAANGAEVQTGALSATNNTLDLSRQPIGIYYLTLDLGNGKTATTAIIKN